MEQPHILFIAPDTQAANEVGRLMNRELGTRHRLSRLARLDEAEIWLDWNVADAIVADLELPDANGAAVVGRLRAAAVATPIVCLVGGSGLEAALAGLAGGAADYLRADQLQPRDVLRIGHYAQAHAREARLRDLELTVADYRKLCAPCTVPDDGGEPLRARDPSLFGALGTIYRDLLSDYVRYAAGAAPRPDQAIDDLMRRAAAATATPADLVELHTASVDEMTLGGNAERGQMLIVEGRLLALELMARLASHYRARAIAAGAAR